MLAFVGLYLLAVKMGNPITVGLAAAGAIIMLIIT